MKLHSVSLLFILITVCSCVSTSDLNRGYLIPSAGELTEIEFSTTKDLIFLEAKVNGVSGIFVFDNGASLSAVNPDFAIRANIKPGKKSKITDANNNQKSLKESTADTVIIGGHKFIKTGFYILDTKKFLPCDTIDGIIGASIINKANWEIDFIRKKMRISSRVFEDPGYKMSISFSSNNSSFTTISIMDQLIKCKIDLGSSRNIKLRKEKYYSLFLNAEAEKRVGIVSRSVTGLGNIDTIYQIRDLIDITHGQTKLPVQASVQLFSRMKYAGYIGIDFFNDYLLTINSNAKEYILSENKNHQNSPQKEKSFGLMIYPVKDHWLVIQLNPNQKRLEGIEVMDKVVAIDNIPFSDFGGFCEFEDYWQKKKENEESILISLEQRHLEIPFEKQASIILN